jgi:lysozyme family protein
MADAKTAFLITIDPEHEGGFQNLHNDRGNWTGGQVGAGLLKGTKYGISAAQFPTLDIENLTPEQAIEIYVEGYWKTLYSQIDSQEIANKLADLGVLFGVGTAVRMLQVTLGITADGNFGPGTLEATNAHDADSLLTAYKTTFVTHAAQVGAANPLERQYVGGWVKRINS